MLITGTHTCEHCNSNIDWEYLITQPIRHGTIFDLYKINKNASRLHIIEQIHNDENMDESEYEYLCQVRCKECYCLNEFTYKSDIEL